MLTRGLFVPFSVARVGTFLEKLAVGRGRAGEGGGEGESKAFSKTRMLVAKRGQRGRRPARWKPVVRVAGSRDGHPGDGGCWHAPTRTLVCSRRCWRHTSQFVVELKSIPNIMFSHFCAFAFMFVHFPAVATGVANESGNSIGDCW